MQQHTMQYMYPITHIFKSILAIYNPVGGVAQVQSEDLAIWHLSVDSRTVAYMTLYCI